MTASGVVCEHNCLSLKTAGIEMKAVAAQNTRVGDPVYHVILSWPAAESPGDDQAFACGAHALAAVGMAGHQYVFAIHRDTRNVHLHIAANRVNPASFRAVHPDRDYFKLDRAMRELELRYGWRHDSGPYAVFERNGKHVIDWSSKLPETKGHAPTAAADMERHADQESFFSYVRGRPRDAVMAALKDEALSWPALHGVLARYGLELREKGMGFALFDLGLGTTTPVKASDMHEALSKPRLVARLGPFEGAKHAPAPESGYDKHRPPVRNAAQRDERRQERADARRNLRLRYADYKNQFVTRRLDPAQVRARFAALRAEARRRRAEVRATVSNPAARKARYSVIAFETLRERERLRLLIGEERAALREDPGNIRLSYREWVERQAASGDDAAISQLRGWAYAEKRIETQGARMNGAATPNGFRADRAVDPTAGIAIDGVYCRVRRDGSFIYRLNNERDGFIDHGAFIEVLQSTSGQSATVFALLFAIKKYGAAFESSGSESFKKIVSRLGGQHATEAALRDALRAEENARTQRRRESPRARVKGM